MKDSAWTAKIIASIVTIGAGLMCFWTVQTVQKHELVLEGQGIHIRTLQKSVEDMNNSIQEAIKDIKSDLRDLKREARRRNPNFETGDAKQ